MVGRCQGQQCHQQHGHDCVGLLKRWGHEIEHQRVETDEDNPVEVFKHSSLNVVIEGQVFPLALLADFLAPFFGGCG